MSQAPTIPTGEGNMRGQFLRALAVPLLACGLATFQGNSTLVWAQTVATWNVADGDWTTAANWSTDPFYPNNGNGAASYDATINGGSVHLDTDVTLNRLNLNGGELAGAGDLTTASLVLNGGTLATTGAVDAANVVFDTGTLARDLMLAVGSTHDISSLTIAAGSTLTNPAGSELRGLGGTVNGPGGFVNAGTLNKTDSSVLMLCKFTTTATSIVNVQKGTIVRQYEFNIAGVGTHDGTFNVADGAALVFGGPTSSNNTLTASSLVTGAGGMRVQQGRLSITGDDSNDYTGGTTIAFGGRVDVYGTGTALGTGQVTIIGDNSGGITKASVLSIAAPTNLFPTQVVALGAGTITVRSPFIPQSLIAQSSNGTFAVDVVGFDLPVDLSLLGNGSMSLGSSTAGSYTAAILTPGTGGTYRLGGGGGTLSLTQPNVLTGDRLVSRH